MAKFGTRSGCLFPLLPCSRHPVGPDARSLPLRREVRERGGWRAVLRGLGWGLGLALCTLGPVSAAAAASAETGEAEAAPAPPPGEQPAGRLIVAKPDPVNPARIVAHTAQLPKARVKPLFPVELPDTPAGRAAATAPRPARPAAEAGSPPDSAAAKPVPSERAHAAAAKVGPAGPARRVHLPLAPSAAEIRRELAARNGGPLSAADSGRGGATKAAEPGNALGASRDKPSLGSRLQERATTAPKQNPRWPTHVDYSAGPTGPAGGNTSGDRKGALIEATGPQQGVIRNRW